MLFWKKKSTSPIPEGATDLVIQLGGYYVLGNHRSYQLLRLLDFSQTVYHVQSFQETFDHLPMQAETALVHPQSMHAVYETKELLGQELTLIKAAPLNAEDLIAYGEYLQANGYEQAEIDAMNERVLASSVAPPKKIRLLPSDSGVTLASLDGTAS